jgi:pyroglutamyl-peptidase
MSETFLVTGFEPFAEHRANSSWEALAWLRPRWPATVVTLRLPVDHHRAHLELRRALDEVAPSSVLCTGLARGDLYRIERRARRPEPLATEGPELVHGRWPWEEMRSALEGTGVSAIDSDDAGRYVCESTYWSLLTYRGRAAPPAFAAFLHVPPLSPEQPVERIAAAIASVVDARRASLRDSDGTPADATSLARAGERPGR